jgi:hypothetical protein
MSIKVTISDQSEVAVAGINTGCYCLDKSSEIELGRKTSR